MWIPSCDKIKITPRRIWYLLTVVGLPIKKLDVPYTPCGVCH